MYIREIEIDNFRSIQHLTLSNLQSMNIFYGANNVGKSNILQAVDYFFDTLRRNAFYNNSQTLYYFDRDDLYNCNENLKMRIRIKFDIQLPGESNFIKQLIDNKFMTLDGDAPGTIDTFFDISLTYEFEKKRPFSRQIMIEHLKLGNTSVIKDYALTKVLPSQSSRNDMISGIGLFDIFENLSQYYRGIPWFRIISREVRQDTSEISDFDNGNYTNILLHLQDGKTKNKQELFNKINRDFKELTNAGDISIVLGSRTEYDSQGNAKIIGTTEVYVKDAEKMVPLSSMGSSAQQLLYVLVNYYYFYDSVIGFEEPEIHLSPESQEKFYQYLSRLYLKEEGKRQIFITTHSPTFTTNGYIIQVFYDEHQTKVKKEGEPGELEERAVHFGPCGKYHTPACFGKFYNEISDKCRRCVRKTECKPATEEHNRQMRMN